MAFRTMIYMALIGISTLMPNGAAAASAAPNVTYTAIGIFAATPLSGTDTFQLAGKAFSISVIANAAATPSRHGQLWAQYSNLQMSGTVNSGLIPTPIAISSPNANILLAIGNPKINYLEMGFPVRIAGLQLSVIAEISVPVGTIPTAHIHPFTAPAKMAPSNARMTYTDGTSSTTLGINGTLNATIPPAIQAGTVAPDRCVQAWAPEIACPSAVGKDCTIPRRRTVTELA
ncbi:MAG: hypothetical protein U0Q18_02990 [Bryobacteraceae bacterium]